MDNCSNFWRWIYHKGTMDKCWPKRKSRKLNFWIPI